VNMSCSRASPSYLILFLCAYLRVPAKAIGGMFAKIERHLPTSTTFSFAGPFAWYVGPTHTNVRIRSCHIGGVMPDPSFCQQGGRVVKTCEPATRLVTVVSGCCA
jgi:hypothetical protein